MHTDLPFGRWLKRRRVELRLTQTELAQRVSYSVVTIRKIESEELRPSLQITERLADHLMIPAEDRTAFVRFARGEGSSAARSGPSPPLERWDPATVSAQRLDRLPIPATALIGRAQEVAGVRQLLLHRGVRLVTLAGSGGVGKTRVALEVARELADQFANGVCFVDLASIKAIHLVMHAIAAALGLQERMRAPLLDTLQEYLQPKELLLLLDNFEHVIAEAPLVAQLLGAAPGLRILVTSREVLRLSGEYEFRVAPLATPAPGITGRAMAGPPAVEELLQYPAIELFVRRAGAVQPDFALSTHNAAAVVEICARLDGVPLALELAAARLRLFTPWELVERLSGRLALLVGGPRDLPARQRTLRATLAWSYDLLDAAEQRLFRRLAVFVGGCSLQAAEAVCYPSGDRTPGFTMELESLLDKNLLWRRETENGAVRIGMLETIREYAEEQLGASPEAPATHKRHAEFFLRLAETAEPELRGPHQRAHLAQLDTEHDNVRAALRWALDEDAEEIALRLAGALRWFWTVRSHVSEGYEQVMTALRKPGASSADAVRAKALWCAGVLAWLCADPAASALLAESAEIWRAAGDKRGLAYALQHLGLVALWEGEPAQARGLERESLALFEAAGDRQGASLALLCLAHVAVEGGDLEDADRLLGTGVAICRETGDTFVLALTLREIGHLAARRADFALARAPLEESIRLFAEMGTKHELATTLDDAATVASAGGDHAYAEWLWQQALAWWRELGDARGAANDLRNLGHTARIRGNYGTARSWLRESLRLLRVVHEREPVCALLKELGALAAAEGRTERAEVLYRAAEVVAAEARGPEAAGASGAS